MANVLHWNGGGSFDGEVVGESHYQADLKRLSGGERRKNTTAQLVCESNNQHDKNAVKVEIAGKTVGHLSREDAIAHRNRLQALKQGGAIVECPAVIVTGGNGACGVYLDVEPGEAVPAAATQSPSAARPMNKALIMLLLFATVIVCGVAQNPIVAVVCAAAAAWLLWKWKRAGGKLL
jgi:hypothetical protein